MGVKEERENREQKTGHGSTTSNDGVARSKRDEARESRTPERVRHVFRKRTGAVKAVKGRKAGCPSGGGEVKPIVRACGRDTTWQENVPETHSGVERGHDCGPGQEGCLASV